MERKKKAVVRIIASTLSNVAVIGFGLAVYESRPLAFFTGITAITLAILLTWSSES